jgi:hypothetical protein
VPVPILLGVLQPPYEEAPTNMNLRHLLIAAAGLATAALAACGGPSDFVPAAATSGVVTASPAPATGSLAPCSGDRWTGAVSPEGRPDKLDAGDAGAVYVWHDGDGWHVRATDMRATDHHYTGTVTVSRGASFTNVRPVRDERDDRISVDGDGVLHYDFHTFASIDGMDFRVTCQSARERLTFHTEFDGRPVSDRVRIGDTKQSPKAATFSFVRAA